MYSFKCKSLLFKTFCSSSNSTVVFPKLLGLNSNILGLYLNSPKNRNALSRNLIDSLKNNITEINTNHNIRAVIMMSKEPGYFCAGADQKQRQSIHEAQTEEFVSDLRNTFQLFSEIRVPSICAIDGFALGGGLELALSADIRICTKGSTLGLTECALGIIPGAGGTQKLPRIVGVSRAKEMIFTAERLNGEKALSIGLVNYIVDKYEDLEPYALNLAEKIVKNAPLSIVNAKKAINQGIGLDIKTGLSVESLCYANILRTEDRIEGLKAFLEKRQPQYKGK
jgi:methylglutaconyl-CoA hydratase